MDKQIKKQKLAISVAMLIVLVLACVSLVRGQAGGNGFSIGERFHYETSISKEGVVGDKFREKPQKPAQYKEYAKSKKILLPAPAYRGLSVEEAIYKRRSIRNYSEKPVSLKELSQLLFAAQGVTGKSDNQALRSAPSAGALYPFEVYLVVNNVQDLPRGIYHYAVMDHALEQIKSGDFREKITTAGLKQEMLGTANVTFVLSAIFDRTRYKYGERGLRYVYIEAGHIGQNICLQATSLGLGSCCVGAFLDDDLNKLIDVDGRKEAAIYVQAVGSL
jgi:SagB-type dehydrogenase family enzyme